MTGVGEGSGADRGPGDGEDDGPASGADEDSGRGERDGSGDGSRSGGAGSRSRRSYLGLVGLAVAAAGLGGLAWAIEDGGRGHRTVNLADHGVDATGGEPIDSALDDVAADDTTVRLPEGTYRLDSFRPGPLSNFALEGDGATLVPPQGSTDVIVDLVGTDVALRGLTFDYTAEDTAAQVAIRCTDGLLVEDCAFVGVADVRGGRGRSGHEYHLMPAVTDPDGEGVVRNVSLADGSASPSNRGGVWMGGDSAGRLRFENVHLERWANNSLYVEESDGTLEVVGSRFVNNNVGGPRVAARTVRVVDTRVVADGEIPVAAFSGKRESRGVWIDDDCEEVLVENCEFELTGPHAGDAIVFQDWSDDSPGPGPFCARAGRATDRTRIDVRNCQFVLREGLQPIRRVAPGATVATADLDVRVAD